MLKIQDKDTFRSIFKIQDEILSCIVKMILSQHSILHITKSNPKAVLMSSHFAILLSNLSKWKLIRGQIFMF